MEKEEYIYTWEEFFNDCKLLAAKIEEGTPFKAIARSGLIVAGQIAQFTNTRKIDSICLSSHNQRTPRGEVKVFSEIESDEDFSGFIIDDIVDTGTTMKYVKSKFPNAKIAVPLWKGPSDIEPDLYIKKLEKHQWVVYPWEID